MNTRMQNQKVAGFRVAHFMDGAFSKHGNTGKGTLATVNVPPRLTSVTCWAYGTLLDYRHCHGVHVNPSLHRGWSCSAPGGGFSRLSGLAQQPAAGVGEVRRPRHAYGHSKLHQLESVARSHFREGGCRLYSGHEGWELQGTTLRMAARLPQ